MALGVLISGSTAMEAPDSKAFFTAVTGEPITTTQGYFDVICNPHVPSGTDVFVSCGSEQQETVLIHADHAARFASAFAGTASREDLIEVTSSCVCVIKRGRFSE